jgi:hypothetical protein
MAVIHTVSDPEKVALLQKVGSKMSTACTASKELTDEDAETQLCTLCADVRVALKSGAELGGGPMKNGDLFVLTSSDPKVQAKIAKVEEKFAMAMASHE